MSEQLKSPFERALERKLDGKPNMDENALPANGTVSSPVGWRKDPIDGVHPSDHYAVVAELRY